MKAPRKRRRREEWERLLAELRASGQTAAEFASARGIAPSTLHTWQRRAAAASTPPGGGRGLFSEVRVVEPRVAERRVEVVARSGRIVRFHFDPQLLRDVLKVVESC